MKPKGAETPMRFTGRHGGSGKHGARLGQEEQVMGHMHNACEWAARKHGGSTLTQRDSAPCALHKAVPTRAWGLMM
jgi:hypothetical protein